MGNAYQTPLRKATLIAASVVICGALLVAVSINQVHYLHNMQAMQTRLNQTQQMFSSELAKYQAIADKLLEFSQQKLPAVAMSGSPTSSSCSSYFTGMYMGAGTVLCHVKPLSIPMMLEGSDKGITPHLCRGYGWEPETSAVFKRLVKPGFYVLDVGTNVGYYTVMFTQLVGLTGHVLGIEASPRTFDLVSTTLEMNGYSSTSKVINRAAFDADDHTVQISIARDRSLNNKVVLPGTASSKTAQDTADVKTITIDTAVSGWNKLDFIKIDVEGAEQMAYHGMRKTLARFPNVTVIMEVNTVRMGVDKARQFYQELQRDYSQLYRLIRDRISPTTAEDLLANRQGDDMVVLTKRQDILTL